MGVLVGFESSKLTSSCVWEFLEGRAESCAPALPSLAPGPLEGKLYTPLLFWARPFSFLGQPFKRGSLSQAPSSLTDPCLSLRELCP